MRVIRIGRDLCNDYIIGHPMVSGVHAELYVYDNGLMQLVEHSTNGTYVNGNFVHNETYVLTGTEVLFFPDQNPVRVSTILSAGQQSDPIPAQNPLENRPKEKMTVSPGMDFGATLGYFFDHYADFSGRARRKEYWYMFLWNMIFSCVPIINLIWWLVVLIPNWAQKVRRLHDTGRSGWWLFLYLIPLVGSIIIFVWTVSDSDPYKNEYGPSPKYS